MAEDLDGDRPLDHVERPSLPWRETDRLTECGLRADSYPTITRDQLRSRAAKLGRQRTHLVMCITCLNTAQRWPSWDENPVGALGREINQMRGPSEVFRDELLAIAALIDAHRDEFDEAVAGLGDVVQLGEQRSRLRYRRG